MARPLAALTGATGFLGRHLVSALNAAGFDVRVLARRPPQPGFWTDYEPQVVAGALDLPEALEALAEGAAVVIHAAGLVKARTPAEFQAVNVQGVRALAAAANRRAPGAQVILVSSLSARPPQFSAYGSSKAAGEAVMAAMIAPERLTILRPPAVYGPGDRETLSLFLAAKSLPVLPLIGGDDARFALIHVADAAAHIAAAAARPPGGVYALSDARPEGYGWREVMQAAAEAVGRRPSLARTPPGLVLAAGGLSAAFDRLRGRAPMLGHGKTRELLHPDWGLRSHELWTEAPAARFDLTSGFAQTVSWYCNQGWL